MVDYGFRLRRKEYGFRLLAKVKVRRDGNLNVFFYFLFMCYDMNDLLNPIGSIFGCFNLVLDFSLYSVKRY